MCPPHPACGTCGSSASTAATSSQSPQMGRPWTPGSRSCCRLPEWLAALRGPGPMLPPSLTTSSSITHILNS
eukprot:scaffold12895_cov20-Tisochrysis_lutea.AAC.2